MGVPLRNGCPEPLLVTLDSTKPLPTCKLRDSVCPAGCGGPVTAPSGEIHSPSYPNSYPNNVDCSWVISVEPNHRVFFNFSDLDIEFHSNCSWDYVAVSKHPGNMVVGRCSVQSSPV